MSLQDILVGVDGSDESSQALAWAAGLAEATACPIRALSSWGRPSAPSWSTIGMPLPSQACIAASCATNLERAVSKAGVSTEIAHSVHQGDPGVVLAGETKSTGLVVVGRNGDGGRGITSRIAEFTLGSAAKYCVHHADGPVAVVPPGQTWSSNPTVVVGVDGSPASHAALSWTVENLPGSTEIIALQIVPPYVEGLLALDPEAVNRIVATTEDQLRSSIRASVSRLGPQVVSRVTPLVLVDNARYALTDPGFDVDVVIVGERGRGAIGSRLLGSVTDHAIRYATCPVIVVPRPSHDH